MNEQNIAAKIGLAVVLPVAFILLAEGVLRVAGWPPVLREKKAIVPVVAMKFGTVIEQLPTELDPPGYLWRVPENYVVSDPRMAEFRWPRKLVEGRQLIAFLGGSTTQPDGLRSYPRRCLRLLNQAAGKEQFEMMNCGLSFYSTHQSLIVLQRYVLPLRPDYVVVYHGWNDPTLASDGYGDSEKDHLSVAGPKRSWLSSLRLSTSLGWLAQRKDQSWPRVRVDFATFEANLRRMAELCASVGATLVVVSRPATRAGAVPEVDEATRHVYAGTFGADKQDIYFGIHRAITAAQARVVSAYPTVRLTDTSAYLDQKQQEMESLGLPAVHLFSRDAVHVQGHGNQFIAESVARAVAPGLANVMAAITRSPGYWSELAEEFLAMSDPHLAVYAAQEARRFPGADFRVLDQLTERATNDFFFADLFERYRWGSPEEHSLEERLAGLQQCLLVKPTDFGVLQQIYRVCENMGSPAQAWPHLRNFRSRDANDHYRWLALCLQSAVARQDTEQVRSMAQALLKLNPADLKAREALVALP